MDRTFTQKLNGERTAAKEIEEAFKTVGIVARAKIERLCSEGKTEEAQQLENALCIINNTDYNN